MVKYVSSLASKITINPELKEVEMLTQVSIGNIQVVTTCTQNCFNCHWHEVKRIQEIDGVTEDHSCSNLSNPKTSFNPNMIVDALLVDGFDCEYYAVEELEFVNA